MYCLDKDSLIKKVITLYVFSIILSNITDIRKLKLLFIQIQEISASYCSENSLLINDHILYIFIV